MRARPPRNTVDGSLRGGPVTDQHWTAYGACSGAPPDDLFVEGAAQRTAREVCANCAVRVDCLIDALDHRIPVSYTHLRAHETDSYLVCRLLLEKKKTTTT